MKFDFLSLSCDEWRDLSDAYPAEMEVITEMLIDAEAEICGDLR